MDRRLFAQAMGKFSAGVLLVAALLFIPAGSLSYWQGWLLMGVLFIPMFCAGLVMLWRSPELLRKRLSAREREGAQRRVVALSAVMFLAAFLVAGLNARFGWLRVPAWVCWAAAAVFLAGYIIYAEVLRENAFLSRTVEVQRDQRVIDTGLYGIVRHPMYAATLLLFFSMPLILGSPLSLAIMLLYIPIIAGRIRNEERVLEEGLPGYAAYRERVKYKMIPHIW